MFFRSQRGCALFFLCVIVCCAKETVCLKNGFCLDVDSHTQNAGKLVLQVGSGSLELPASDVAHIQIIPAARPNVPVQVQPQITATAALKHAAESTGLPEALIRSVARIESGFQQNAVSMKGAIGLMQLMPGTAVSLGVNPNLAMENAQGGAMYLRALLLRYHGDSALALAAYNAGPGAVKQFGTVPPYEETRRYVVKVLKEYERLHKLESKTTVEALTNTTSATN
jgi:hypothetical protein